MKKVYNRKPNEAWEAEQREKKENLADKIANIANQWHTNPQDLAEFFRFKSRFHNYSAGNSILIYQQNRNASFCGSFQKYKEMGYSVKRGEKGIQIFVPVIVTLYRANADDEWKKLSEAPKAEKEKITGGQYETRQIRKYKIGNVFDISQTTCPLEDYPKILQNVGYSSEQHNRIFNAISAYSLDVLHCPVTIADIKSVTTHGFYRPMDNTITISDRLKDTELLHVLTHEFGHAIVHNYKALQAGMDKSEAQIELEADAVSIMLQDHVGVPLTDGLKSHLSAVYKTFADQQSERDTETQTTIENIISNVSDIYNTHIDALEHYINNELTDINQERVNYFSIQQNEDVFTLFGANSQTTAAFTYGNFDSIEQAEMSLESTTNSPDFNVQLNRTDLHTMSRPLVHVIWSEDPSLSDDTYLNIKDAQNIFETLDFAQKEKQGYNKTSFQIILADGTEYTGRQDFGDGDGGIIDHIQKYWQDELSMRNDLSEDEISAKKQAANELVKTLWDAYDDNYIDLLGKKLEQYKLQGDSVNTIQTQNNILMHLTNKRNRILEFKTTGITHKEPIISSSNDVDANEEIDTEM